MRNLFLTLSALTAVFAANAGTTWMLGTSEFAVDTLYSATAGPGVVTTGLKITNPSNTTVLHYSVIDLTNPNLEIHGVEAYDDGDLVENVKSMGDRKSEDTGKQYIAGVNGDYFNMGDSPTRTNCHAMADGILYNTASTNNGFLSYVTVAGDKDIRIFENLNASLDLNFPDGTKYPFGVNGTRATDQIRIYTTAFGDTTGTNMWGTECEAKVIEGREGKDGSILEITGAPESGVGSMKIKEGYVVLSGHGAGAAILKDIKVGDRVTINHTISLDDRELNISQMIGGMSMLLIEGQLPTRGQLTQPVNHFTSNQARTVIGYNEDRTKLIMLVADKYGSQLSQDPFKQTFPEKSTGLVMRRMAFIMQQLGCYTAMAYDGGGSSQLYNYGFGVRNSPYGGDYLRPVANGIFAVSNTPIDENIAYIEAVYKDVMLNEGESHTPLVYAYNQYGVVVNNDFKDYKLTVAEGPGTVADKTFTAGNAKGSTVAVIEGAGVKCGVRIYTNGGGEYVTSGDDQAPVFVEKPYVSDEPMGSDKLPDDSGIGEIIADTDNSMTDSAPVYYNLQGMRVQNPANGIYIVRRGNKVSKQYIR